MAAIVVHSTHCILHRYLLEGLDPRDRRALRLERAATCGDHHRLAAEGGAGVGGESEAAVIEPFQRLDHLAEMELRFERLDLLQQIVHQPLGADLGVTGNVVDRLLGIELGALAARPVENVDEVAFDLEEPELEDREQPDRAGSDDHDVRFDWFAHSPAVPTC